MTSHDPLVIASLKGSQVRIMHFDKKTNSIIADTPETDPVKMGYPEILTSDLFGLRSSLNPTIQKYLDEKQELSTKEKLSEKELERLSELNGILDDFDITSVRDPCYEQFAKEMKKREQEEKLQKVSLTKSEQEKRDQIASEIIKKIKSTGAK